MFGKRDRGLAVVQRGRGQQSADRDIAIGDIEMQLVTNPAFLVRTPRFYEQKARPLGRADRQFFITDLGHDEPTILLTNDAKSTAKTIITRYAKRMIIENALSDAVRFFHIDALSSSVGFKVDFDMALLVIASGLYRLMAHRMRGYDDAQARQIFRDRRLWTKLMKRAMARNFSWDVSAQRYEALYRELVGAPNKAAA